MWPHKAGLGVQLSYGVDGNGVFVRPGGSLTSFSSSNTSDLLFQFPRLKDESKILYRSATQTELVSPQTSAYDLNTKVYQELQDATYVPEEILKSYIAESKLLTSSIVYDPTIGSLFEFHDARMKKGKKYGKVLAHVSGDTSTILNVCFVQKQSESTQGSSHYIESTLSIPVLSPPTQVSFSSPIKQIHFSKLAETFDYVPSFLLVRTDSSIYILNVLRTVSLGVELTIVDELSSSLLNGNSFADVSFNPWNFSQFAAIDVKGNFGIWNISSNISNVKKLAMVLKDTTSVPDVSELSNWKRISWSYNHNHILVATRSSLTEIEIDESQNLNLIMSTKIVTSSWSRILDIRRCSHFGFLLTSKELIWLSLKSSPTRIMSWKHFLDENDPSLKVQVSQTVTGLNPEFMCTIYSQVRLLLFVYSFGMRDGTSYSLHDPYYLRSSTGLIQVEIINLNKDFYSPLEDVLDDSDSIASDSELQNLGLFELKNDLQLSLGLLTTTPSSTSSKESTPIAEKSAAKVKRSKISKVEIERLATAIKLKYQNLTNDSTVELVQKYALKLGTSVNKVDSNPSLQSLLDISHEIPNYVDDVSEIDTMVEQLSNYYKDNNIITANFLKSPIIKGKLGETESQAHLSRDIESIEDLSIALKGIYGQKNVSIFNDEMQINQASVLLGASFIQAKSAATSDSQYSQKFRQELEDSPSKVQSILSKWGDENVTSDIALTVNSQMTVPDSSMPPTLRLSSQIEPSSQRLKRKKSNRSSRLSQLSQFSQLSQSRFPPTNNLHSQPPKDTRILSMEFTSPLSSPKSSQIMLTSPVPSQRSLQRYTQGSQRLFKKKKKKGGFA